MAEEPRSDAVLHVPRPPFPRLPLRHDAELRAVLAAHALPLSPGACVFLVFILLLPTSRGSPVDASSLFRQQYAEVCRIAESCTSDTPLSSSEYQTFRELAACNDDYHPDAYACRLRLWLATMGEIISFTVTVHANPADTLTRSP